MMRCLPFGEWKKASNWLLAPGCWSKTTIKRFQVSGVRLNNLGITNLGILELKKIQNQEFKND